MYFIAKEYAKIMKSLTDIECYIEISKSEQEVMKEKNKK